MSNLNDGGIDADCNYNAGKGGNIGSPGKRSYIGYTQ